MPVSPEELSKENRINKFMQDIDQALNKHEFIEVKDTLWVTLPYSLPEYAREPIKQSYINAGWNSISYSDAGINNTRILLERK
jgi:hypothetical protein